MIWELPASIASHAEAGRVLDALQASAGAGAALMVLRGADARGREVGTQLKTAVDRAAEGWVLGFLEARHPEDAFLAEERHGDTTGEWEAPGRYWTVDALDGTRSFVDGYPGFCVQVAFVDPAGPLVGVVHEPVASCTYVAARGAGAYQRTGSEPWRRLRLAEPSQWPARPRFVDSTVPKGTVGELMRRHDGRFVECGSIGLKICRVADGTADIFMKEFAFKLWDVAPGEVVLREAGGVLATWSGSTVDYGRGPVVRRDLLAAAPALVRASVAMAASRPG